MGKFRIIKTTNYINKNRGEGKFALLEVLQDLVSANPT